MPAFRAAITQARPAACFVGDVMFEVALGGGAAADRADAGGVPDLGQVPQLHPGVVSPGLEPVVTVAGAEGVKLDDQVVPLPGCGTVLGRGAGAAVERGVPVLV